MVNKGIWESEKPWAFGFIVVGDGSTYEKKISGKGKFCRNVEEWHHVVTSVVLNQVLFPHLTQLAMDIRKDGEVSNLHSDKGTQLAGAGWMPDLCGLRHNHS